MTKGFVAALVAISIFVALVIGHIVSKSNECEERGGTYISRSDVCIKKDGVIQL